MSTGRPLAASLHGREPCREAPGERTLTSLRPVPNLDTRRPFAHAKPAALEPTVRRPIDRRSGRAGNPLRSGHTRPAADPLTRRPIGHAKGT
jgi:hypothetical protein